MRLSTDEVILYQQGIVTLNATIALTWLIMLLLAFGSWLITRKLVITGRVPRWQSGLEIVVSGILSQLQEIGLPDTRHYLGFIGSLFLFIATSNLLIILPFYEPPTGSLSTTAALAISVFFAVPVFGIGRRGFWGYLSSYREPTFLMAPFHLLSEVSRTIALTVRLFGNVMSGTVIVAILLAIIPLFFPIIMTLIGLITGLVQAYIFSVLAAVYIAAAVRAHEA